MADWNREKLTAIVRECVNAYDPQGLLKVGCPGDEYAPEIEAIAQSLRPKVTRTEIWLIICNTLHWYFRPHDEPVLYWRKHYDLADEILHRLRQLG